MRQTRFSDEQIVTAVSELSAGGNIADISRKYGVCKDTIYNWRKKFSGMQSSEVRKSKSLEDENSKLKRIVAIQAVELLAAKDIISRFT